MPPSFGVIYLLLQNHLESRLLFCTNAPGAAALAPGAMAEAGTSAWKAHGGCMRWARMPACLGAEGARQRQARGASSGVGERGAGQGGARLRKAPAGRRLARTSAPVR